MNREESESATAIYLRKRLRWRVVGLCMIALFAASVVIAHTPDDWGRFDHRSFRVTDVHDGVLNISSGDEVMLPGVTNCDTEWLRDRVSGEDVTLLLQSPETRDGSGHLRAFAYLRNLNLSVEAVKEGTARMDRKEKTVFDGVLGPAEVDARKKKRGIWGEQFSGGPEGRAPGPPGRR